MVEPNPTPTMPTIQERITQELARIGYILKPQEIPFNHPDSICRFRPGKKPFVATPAAIEMHGETVILTCHICLMALARFYNGIDYLQVFESKDKPEALWFIEDGNGGAITALLPSDY